MEGAGKQMEAPGISKSTLNPSYKAKPLFKGESVD